MNSLTAGRDSVQSVEAIIEALDLEPHIEGGFFRRTYQADHRQKISIEGDRQRFLMTSIFYLLTAESSVGQWHCNTSDIVHYYHLGDPIEYSLIHPNGELDVVRMGSNVIEGEKLQLTVKGGVWKRSHLLEGDVGYGLISEAVSPGFDYEDMVLGQVDKLVSRFPQHREIIEHLSQSKEKKL